jgi:hypothetical protein
VGEFKSGEWKKLLDAGYVIVGNISDHWTDIDPRRAGGCPHFQTARPNVLLQVQL